MRGSTLTSRCSGRLKVISCGLVASLLVSVPFASVNDALMAQGPSPVAAEEIRPGIPVRATMPVSEPGDSERPFHDYEISLAERQSIRIEMTSPDPEKTVSNEEAGAGGFDTYLELRREGSDEILRSDDDSGGELNSRMLFVAPAAGKYIIRARPFSYVPADADPSYMLRVTLLPPAPEPRDFAGSRVEGRLGADSPEGEGYEPYRYAAYRLQGSAGERIQLDLTSSANRPALQVTDSSGTIVGDAIGFDRNRVRLIAVLPANGTYEVQVQTPIDEEGDYRLDLRRATSPAARTIDPILIGQSLPSELNLDSSASSAPGSFGIDFFYKLFSLQVEQGRPVTVTLNSADFEGILEAGVSSVLGFQPALIDSVMGSSPARLYIEPIQSGTVILRVRSAGLDTGSFELGVAEGIVPPSEGEEEF